MNTNEELWARFQESRQRQHLTRPPTRSTPPETQPPTPPAAATTPPLPDDALDHLHTLLAAGAAIDVATPTGEPVRSDVLAPGHYRYDTNPPLLWFRPIPDPAVIDGQPVFDLSDARVRSMNWATATRSDAAILFTGHDNANITIRQPDPAETLRIDQWTTYLGVHLDAATELLLDNELAETNQPDI